MTDTTLVHELADPAAITRELDEVLVGEGEFTVTRLTSGLSNEIFRIARTGRSWVLRRPPRTVSVRGAHDVVREYRILSALRTSGVPHAEPLHLCEDPTGIGAPFFVMREVDGIALTETLPESLQDSRSKEVVAFQLIDAMAALHALDWRAAGLGDLGWPEGFTERLVGRWMKQYRGYPQQRVADLDAAAALLTERIPAGGSPVLIHADMGLHNALYRRTVPSRLDAIVDWETTTIGDASLDLGHLLSSWLTDPADRERWWGSRIALDLAGFPSAERLAERYRARSGREIADLDWYRAVAQLRIAVILEGAYQRHLGAGTDNPRHAALGDRVPNIAARSLAIARGEA